MSDAEYQVGEVYLMEDAGALIEAEIVKVSPSSNYINVVSKYKTMKMLGWMRKEDFLPVEKLSPSKETIRAKETQPPVNTKALEFPVKMMRGEPIRENGELVAIKFVNGNEVFVVPLK